MFNGISWYKTRIRNTIIGIVALILTLSIASGFSLVYLVIHIGLFFQNYLM